jgi:hypothetical protein
MRWIVAPSASEKSNGILCAARQKLKMLRVAGVLKYDHHSISEAWLPCAITDKRTRFAQELSVTHAPYLAIAA